METPVHANPKPSAAEDEQLLLAYVAQRDVPCPVCKYNLRQLQSSRCPECGNQLKLSVGVVGNLSTNWIVALVASLLAAGIGLPFQILALITAGLGGLSEITREPEGFIFLMLVLYSLICIPVVIVLLAKRTWFVTLKSETQNVLAGMLVMFDILAALTALALIGSVL